ncbi:MAG: 4Fe-4S dicluster domain-containing protein [Proteobacteria bacterium]|nr:4Fe-4S dicluster domain-containing protein [Pseudomonadota bacterium]
MTKKKKKFKVLVKSEYCKACNLCIAFCKENALKTSGNLNQMGYDYAEADESNPCNGCMICVLVCPDLVIEVYDE